MPCTRAHVPINHNYAMDKDQITCTVSVRYIGEITWNDTFKTYIMDTSKKAFRRLEFVLRELKNFQGMSAVKCVNSK